MRVAAGVRVIVGVRKIVLVRVTLAVGVHVGVKVRVSVLEGVGVAVSVGVGVSLGVGVAVRVGVSVAPGMSVDVGVGLDASVGVGVTVGEGEAVAVGLAVTVDVDDWLGVALAVAPAVGDSVVVRVGVESGGRVEVGLALGVGVAHPTIDAATARISSSTVRTPLQSSSACGQSSSGREPRAMATWVITSATETIPSPSQSGHDAGAGLAAKKTAHASSAASDGLRLSTPRLRCRATIVVLPSAAPRAEYRNSRPLTIQSLKRPLGGRYLDLPCTALSEPMLMSLGRGIFASLRREWLPRLDDPRERSAVAAVLLSLALAGAPLMSSLRSVCDQCPVTCPMHQPASTKQHKPSCHAGGAPSHHHGHGKTGANKVGFTRPPCSHHGVVPGVALAPMILPGAIHTQYVPVARGIGAPAPLAHARNNDPPDTPPPIVFA